MSTDRRKRGTSDPPGSAERGEGRAASGLETLGRELEGARAEADRYKDLYLRARADLENQQKHAAREIETRTKHRRRGVPERLYTRRPTDPPRPGGGGPVTPLL